MALQPTLVKTSLVKSRMRGWKSILSHHTLRRIIQAGFAVFILLTTVQHITAGENSMNITASPEAYCPFGGLETLYKYISSGGTTVSHTHISNLVLLVAVLLTALLARSAFCGWVCPLGFLQDLISSFLNFLAKRFPGVRRGLKTLKLKGTHFAFLDRYLQLVKYIVLVWAISGTAVYGVMVFRNYDPWSALINIAEFSFTPGVVVLGFTLVAFFFCRSPLVSICLPLGSGKWVDKQI
jgi:polyferredoxin